VIHRGFGENGSNDFGSDNQLDQSAQIFGCLPFPVVFPVRKKAIDRVVNEEVCQMKRIGHMLAVRHFIVRIALHECASGTRRTVIFRLYAFSAAVFFAYDTGQDKGLSGEPRRWSKAGEIPPVAVLVSLCRFFSFPFFLLMPRSVSESEGATAIRLQQQDAFETAYAGECRHIDSVRIYASGGSPTAGPKACPTDGM
jgi:hypothetical protein